MNELIGTATYSPDDNKIRIYPHHRLDLETYQRVKSAGFKWAPQQELFVAPMWTPGRFDLALELCGEVGDEDTSLVDRAEERAERFEDYSEKRGKEASQAMAGVKAISDNIPLGQPILVGHHSERRARKDAERIENGMRKTIKLWETSEYWTHRAAGALRHAKYKELPGVRARRIKGIEADKRKQEKSKSLSEKIYNTYVDPAAMTATIADGRPLIPALLASYDGGLSFDDQSAYDYKKTMPFDVAFEKAKNNLAKHIETSNRWIEHYENRLAYEKAMLVESGGTVADKTGPEKGGACQCWASHLGGWSYIQKVNKISVTVLDNWGNGGKNFTRTIPFDKLHNIMTAAEVQEAKNNGILTETADGTGFSMAQAKSPEPTEIKTGKPKGAEFEALRETLKKGVEVVVAPQLYPTPPDIAARMVELAEIEKGHTVLEPSAGTGNILAAIMNDNKARAVIAVEINQQLSSRLEKEYPLADVHCVDFLVYSRGAWPVDRVIANPPFENGADIKHIKHAMTFLGTGGRLVALCANGPRQQKELQPLADHWEVLPGGSFRQAGTNVNVALLVINA